MKLTNQPLVMILFMMGFMFLPACVVGTTPGDHELSLFILHSLRSSS
jgi:hypothetical protein